jgi:hypothetical protein
MALSCKAFLLEEKKVTALHLSVGAQHLGLDPITGSWVNIIAQLSKGHPFSSSNISQQFPTCYSVRVPVLAHVIRNLHTAAPS